MRRPEKPTLQRRDRLLGPLPLVSPGACESWALNMSAQFDGARVLMEEPSKHQEKTIGIGYDRGSVRVVYESGLGKKPARVRAGPRFNA
jgi:hypothetical protein